MLCINLRKGHNCFAVAIYCICIYREHAQSILPVMRDLDGGGLTEVFPAPHNICFGETSGRHRDLLRKALGSLLLRGGVLVTL
jgi:hypothetical protein